MNPRILIVDDHPVDRRLLGEILGREGFDVSEASTGHEALTAARETVPDLVVLDIGLPDMDGYDVCSALKSEMETSLIPVIFLSAYEEGEQKAKGLELGGADFVSKPFISREVLARIRAQLRLSHLNRSLQELNEELMRLSNDLIDKQRALEEDLQAAARIQHTLLPSGDVGASGIDAGWSFVPCANVGGDLFNFIRLDERKIAFYVVDVTGHGVPSAMVTFSVAQSLAPHMGIVVDQDAEGVVASPREVLERLDREFPLERFDKPFTICYLILDLETGEVVYSAAAHPPPVLLRAAGDVEQLGEGGPVIGLGDMLGFEEGSVRMARGDRLFVYTDGITEQSDEAGELFGEERLLSLLHAGSEEKLQTVCDRIVEAVRRHSGRETPRDDLSLLAIEYRGGPEDG